MDIFRFRNPTAPTKLEHGEIVNGIKSKTWIERYREAGEFSFLANADTGIRDSLPIGSLISHIDSTEVMMVENHEIAETRGSETEIVITGRGLETFFENRIVGSNRTFPTVDAAVDYSLAADETWDQVVTMIKDHILAANLIDDDNALDYVEVLSDVSGAGTIVAREIKRGPLYNGVLELLDVDSLGIRVIRPGPWSPLGAASPNIAFLIHKGVDRSSEVMFSYETGEIESADYLWSNRKMKNAALVTGKWVETWVDTAATKYDRRVMHVDASDIDNAYTTAPTGADFTNVVNAMNQRGLDALAAQKDIALTKAEVSEHANRAIYRTDFNVGDLITVHGDYNETSTMRISEYVEIEDENGQSGHPTLTMIN